MADFAKSKLENAQYYGTKAVDKIRETTGNFFSTIPPAQLFALAFFIGLIVIIIGYYLFKGGIRLPSGSVKFLNKKPLDGRKNFVYKSSDGVKTYIPNVPRFADQASIGMWLYIVGSNNNVLPIPEDNSCGGSSWLTCNLGNTKHVCHLGNEITRDNLTGQTMGIWLGATDNNMIFSFNIKNNKDAITEQIILQDFPMNRWFHVCLVVKGKNISIYKNGKLEIARVFKGDLINNGGRKLYVGRIPDLKDGFPGLLYKGFYNNIAFSPRQVSNIVSSQKGDIISFFHRRMKGLIHSDNGGDITTGYKGYVDNIENKLETSADDMKKNIVKDSKKYMNEMDKKIKQ